MNIKEDLREIIKKNELIRMCSSHFDSDTVTQGIEELIDSIMLFMPEEIEPTLDGIIKYLKTKREYKTVKVLVSRDDVIGDFEIDVWLDDDTLGMYEDGKFWDFPDWDLFTFKEIVYD